ncbi:tRNA pseudouridine(38-40) synthase TruA, partial [Flavobacteriales bacterium]|nr:tRNA pseudouridine(38-40) synthase TruA [Flavobacteriales bacterium]
HTDTFTNNCKVSLAKISELEAGKFVFEIKADRFLRNMVRAIMGTLIQVGKEKLTIEQFQEVIDSLDRGKAGKSVDGKALFLSNVAYDYL